MFCLKGHDHSSIPVKVARHNPTNQLLPFHCSDCWQVSRSDHKEDNWADMALWVAILEGRPHCEDCFPG
jgi:hypothetical protein